MGFFQDIASICVDITYNDACYDKSLIKKRLEKMVSTDPLYVLFTSGSTGIPKGTVVNHFNVVSYIEWFKNCFQINQETVFASQTPFILVCRFQMFFQPFYLEPQSSLCQKVIFLFR